MKKVASVFVILLILASSCVKPYYQTREGKKKQKFYNDIQYGGDKHPKKTF